MSKSGLAILLFPFLLTACSQNNVTEDGSLKKYFDEAGVTGSFGLFDNGQGHFTVYNLSRFRDSAYLPAGTFDIVQSLIGIQTGAVSSDTARVLDSITLRQAFRSPEDSAFRYLAQRIGRDTLKKWIDSLGYGNKKMGQPQDYFWLDNQLTVTADEQLGLTKRLYFDQLPFYKHTQQVVRGMMVQEGNSNYTITYKTGTGVKKDGHVVGWLLGWEEENKHPYFFVVNWESPSGGKASGDVGMSILKGILKESGFFLGKK